MVKTRLSYVVAALAISPAMGCIITSGGDGANGNGNGTGDEHFRGHFDVAWKVDGLDENTGDGCLELPGAATVDVISRPVGGSAFEDINYDCSAGGGVTALLPLGDYDVWANVRDDEGRLLAQSQVVVASIDYDGHLNVIQEELGFLNGEFEATWLLTERYTDDPLTCDEVDAGGFSLLTTLAGPAGTGFDDIFDCPESDSGGDVETDPLPLGDYTVSVALLEDDTDEVLGQTEKQGSLIEHALVVDLGVFEFDFFPEGDEGNFDVVWKVAGFDDDFGDGCLELGAVIVEVVSERVSDGTIIRDIFDCDAGAGITALLPLDDYDVWVNAYDGELDADGQLVASSQLQEVDLYRPRPPVEIPDEFGFLNGQFRATWRLTEDSVDEDPLTCAQVGADEVFIVSTLANSGGTFFDDDFACPAGDTQGDVITASLPLGDYEIDIAVLDDQGVPLNEAPVIKNNSIDSHAALVDLGIFEFFFPPEV